VPRIDLPEPYSVTLARQAVRDSLLSHGEECILLQMYHVGADEGKARRCPVCFDDIYKQSEKANCTSCFGTTFDNGVKSAVRVWGMFTDHVAAEQIGQNGVWTPDQRDVQIEPFPLLTEHDFVVRVRVWDSSHRPIEIEGYYGVQQVTRNSLRTGNKFGQAQWDVVGQKATITELQKNSPIYSYSVVGVQFPDSSLSRGVQIPRVRMF
jgi:hypothetical protein